MKNLQQRRIVPELLDALEPADPAAVRSRRELLTVNRWMGNFDWCLRQLRKIHRPGLSVVEIGAGDGALALLARKNLPGIHWTGIDIAPPPQTWPDDWNWQQGDLLTVPWQSGDVLLANLILHHFEHSRLREMVQRMADYGTCIINEPLRHKRALWGFRALATVFRFGEVTRHDAVVSIAAGFREGELPEIFGWNARSHSCRETESLRGALRCSASIRENSGNATFR